MTATPSEIRADFAFACISLTTMVASGLTLGTEKPRGWHGRREIHMALFCLGLIIGWLIGAVMIGLEFQRSEISLRKGGRHHG